MTSNSLLQGKNSFAVKLNNTNKNILKKTAGVCREYYPLFGTTWLNVKSRGQHSLSL
jgi:hypothetical protein